MSGGRRGVKGLPCDDAAAPPPDPAPSAPELPRLIAGPNGAGETTRARRRLRSVAGTSALVNVAEIGRGLAPLDPTPDPALLAQAPPGLRPGLRRSVAGR